MGKIETISSKVRIKTRMCTVPMLIQCRARNLSQSSKTEERNKRDTNKEEISLFAEDMILYLKDHKDSTKNLINTFGNVTEYKNKHKNQKLFFIPIMTD
jgi:hypothetical protein